MPINASPYQNTTLYMKHSTSHMQHIAFVQWTYVCVQKQRHFKNSFLSGHNTAQICLSNVNDETVKTIGRCKMHIPGFIGFTGKS